MKPVAWYRSLSDFKDRCESGCFLVEGGRGVGLLLDYYREHIVELLCVEGECNVDTDGISVRKISSANMKTISSSRTPQGIAAVVRMPPDVYTSGLPGGESSCNSRILLLEDVQDPGNVGTLIRTAAAFGYDGLVMSGKCADPFAPKAARSTAGSLLSLWIRRGDGYIDMADDLKSRGYTLIGADLDGEEITPANMAATARHVLILGGEGAGISDMLLDKCDRRTRIPIVSSGAESLNVAVSGGILMYLLQHGCSAETLLP